MEVAFAVDSGLVINVKHPSVTHPVAMGHVYNLIPASVNQDGQDMVVNERSVQRRARMVLPVSHQTHANVLRVSRGTIVLKMTVVHKDAMVEAVFVLSNVYVLMDILGTIVK
jgi:hypothetical protein